jgi:hypothetical protein
MKDNNRKIWVLFFAVFMGMNCIFSYFPAYSKGTNNANQQESKPVSVLVNQVGYEVNGEKILVVQLRDTFDKQPAQGFQLIDKSGKIVFSGKLVSCGRVNDGTPDDWGARYWQGEFTRFNTNGEYYARIKMGDEEFSSFPFRIGRNLIFLETMQYAAHFFWFQRCGYEVPGLHPACHMDDATIPEALGGGQCNAAGGWHDAGDFNKYATISCRTVYALLNAGRVVSKQGLSNKSSKEILDEGLWGAEWLYKMWQPGKGIIYQEVWNGYEYWGTPDKETDNLKGTADDRPFRGEGPSAMTAAALAAAARTTGSREYREAAEDLWRGAVKSKSNYPEDIWAKTSGGFPETESIAGRFVRRTSDLLLADLELEALTGEQKYRDNAQSCAESLLQEQKADGLWPSDAYSRTVFQGLPPAALALYVRAHPGTRTSEKAINALRLWMKRNLQLTNNPFNLIPWAEGVFFNPDIKDYWYVGQNSQYLSNAWALYLCGHLFNKPELFKLADRQIDWILGENPYGLCMLEGKGSYNSPNSHYRWGVDNTWKAVPGAIPNGFCRPETNQDCPYYDLDAQSHPLSSWHTAEPWEPHSAFYILAVSARLKLKTSNYLLNNRIN